MEQSSLEAGRHAHFLSVGVLHLATLKGGPEGLRLGALVDFVLAGGFWEVLFEYAFAQAFLGLVGSLSQPQVDLVPTLV